MRTIFSPLKSKWIAGQIWHKDQKVKYLKDGSLEVVQTNPATSDKAPRLVLSTPDFPYEDIDKAVIIAYSLDKEYNIKPPSAEV